MNDDEKAKIKSRLIQDFDFDLAYKISVLCDGAWESAEEIRSFVLKEITELLDEGWDSVYSGGLSVEIDSVEEDLEEIRVRYSPIESYVIRNKDKEKDE